MDVPDPFDISSLNRPDTEIKIFSEVDDGGRLSVLKELRSAKRAGAQVLHVAEPMLVSDKRTKHT